MLGFFIGAEHIVVPPERDALPFAMIEIEHSAGLPGKLGITEEDPTAEGPRRITSRVSHRQTVVPLIDAAIPCSTTRSARSRVLERDSGSPRCFGNSHARA